MSKTIPFRRRADLWVDFYEQLGTNDKNIEQQQKVIVICQDISLDFSEATITIDFPTQPSKEIK
ncbi:hypothetical protein O9992_26855 [Vibrio lentus]|nr:hypothetical protein [Vibrio lentus]